MGCSVSSPTSSRDEAVETSSKAGALGGAHDSADFVVLEACEKKKQNRTIEPFLYEKSLIENILVLKHSELRHHAEFVFCYMSTYDGQWRHGQREGPILTLTQLLEVQHTFQHHHSINCTTPPPNPLRTPLRRLMFSAFRMSRYRKSNIRALEAVQNNLPNTRAHQPPKRMQTCGSLLAMDVWRRMAGGVAPAQNGSFRWPAGRLCRGVRLDRHATCVQLQLPWLVFGRDLPSRKIAKSKPPVGLC